MTENTTFQNHPAVAVRFILDFDFFTGRTVEVDGGAAMGVL